VVKMMKKEHGNSGKEEDENTGKGDRESLAM
jgi:hypothetical protein